MVTMRNSLRKYISLVFIITALFLKAGAYQAEVENISGRDYFPKVKAVIDSAHESIYMSMFVVALQPSHKDSVVYKLCDALIDAKERGVDVKVILDQNIDYYDEEKQIEGKNALAYQYLTKTGIEVYYDNKYKYTHSKAIVIDEKIVIIGSTNWSYSAIEKNNESSVLIESQELAKSLIEEFNKIETEKPVLENTFNEEKAIRIPLPFFTDKNLAGRMITKHDERAFDLYLLMLYNASGKDSINLDFDKYAKDMGIEDMTTTAYRRQIIKTLRKMQKKYKLLEVEFNYAANADVKLLEKDTEKDYLLLPSEYFEYGWNKALTFRAKYCYLINRYMVEEKGSNYWSLSLKSLSDKFHLIPNTITKGMQELRKLNIVDIEYSQREKDMTHSEPSVYKLIGLYSTEEQQKELTVLKKKYGEEKLKKALDFAEVVFKQNDIDAIEQMIKLAEEYGEEKINKAYEILSEKAVDSPKRTLKYAIGVVEGLKE